MTPAVVIRASLALLSNGPDVCAHELERGSRYSVLRADGWTAGLVLHTGYSTRIVRTVILVQGRDRG